VRSRLKDLSSTVERLLRDPGKREGMIAAARALARPNAARDAAITIVRLAGRRGDVVA
jgi:UDP-N-acetylglucosamine:LPS N-acetylglucosamine transferase